MGKKDNIQSVIGQDEEIMMALGMIRHLYQKGEISKTVYHNIRKEYIGKVKNIAYRNKL